MTAVLDRTVDTTAWSIGAPRLLAGLDAADRLDLRAHLATHGSLPGTDLPRLLGHLDASRLAGRGGGGFPLATKLRALAEGPRDVVINGTESEPASRKDRTLLRRTPHLVLDGALAVAAATGARRVTVALHDPTTAASVQAAMAERPDARRVRTRLIDGGFVAGEARAVVRALHGGPALPPGRRTPPTADGTLLANAETFAQLAVLLRIGPHRFAETGTHAEPGTTLLTVGGAVGRPGVVEIPLGTPLGIVLAAAGAPPDPQAIIIGGYHGAWLVPSLRSDAQRRDAHGSLASVARAPLPQIRLSRDGVASAGGSFGAGVLLVLDGRTCALGELARVTAWLAGESAGQCGPCRFGLPTLAADVAALVAGRPAVGSALNHAAAVTGRGACAHPDGAARFVTSGVHLLHDEIDAHLAYGGCGRPVLGQLPLAPVLAPLRRSSRRGTPQGGQD